MQAPRYSKLSKTTDSVQTLLGDSALDSDQN
jgi:hypothetical protein